MTTKAMRMERIVGQWCQVLSALAGATNQMGAVVSFRLLDGRVLQFPGTWLADGGRVGRA